MLGAIDLVRVESHWGCPDLTVAFVDSAHAEAGVQSGARPEERPGRERLGLHAPDAKSGEIEVTPKLPIKTRDGLSMAYTRVGMRPAPRVITRF